MDFETRVINMNRTQLMEIVRNGESSGVEFKRDVVQPKNVAKEIAALANLEGGYILLGVPKRIQGQLGQYLLNFYIFVSFSFYFFIYYLPIFKNLSFPLCL